MDIHLMILVGFVFVALSLPCRTGTVGIHNLKRFLFRYQKPLLINPFMHKWITFRTYVAHLASVTYFIDHNFVNIAFLIKFQSPDILPVTWHLTRILRPVAAVKEVFIYVIDGHLGYLQDSPDQPDCKSDMLGRLSAHNNGDIPTCSSVSSCSIVFLVASRMYTVNNTLGKCQFATTNF